LTPSRAARSRRGFNLIELLVALAITATLMVATMVAIRASFVAYQSTTEVASTNTIARLMMNRIMLLIRTGRDFDPNPALNSLPGSPDNQIVESNELTIPDTNLARITLKWVPDPPDAGFSTGNAIYMKVDSGQYQLLLGGVMPGPVRSAPAPLTPVPPF